MAKAQSYISKSKADNTRRGYRADIAQFAAWCESKKLPALPAAPATVAMYIADLASTAKVSTITRRLAAISKAHQAAGFESPCSLRNAVVAEVLSGIKREKGFAPTSKSPLRCRAASNETRRP